MSLAERQNFEKNFLVTEERRETVQFARLLRRYVTDQKSQPQPATSKKEKTDWKSAVKIWFAPFSSSLPIAAVGLIIVVSVSLLVWEFLPAPFVRQSNGNGFS